MLWWIVDNYIETLIILGAVAATLGVIWWNTRKTWALSGVGITAALMVLVFALPYMVVTDVGQLKLNVAEIRDAVNEGKLDVALRYFDDNVKITTQQGKLDLSKDQILTMANRTKASYDVKQIQTGKVYVDELSRPRAKIRFQVGDADDTIKRGWCMMDCELKNGKWLVTTMTVEALIGGQQMPVLLPVH
jgi:hypothetical protein